MDLNSIFFNEFGRVRSGWRFALFLLSFIVLGILTGSLVAEVLTRLGLGFTPGSIIFLLANSSVSLAIVLFLGWFWGKRLEDLPFRALGAWFTAGWLKNLILGLVIGAGSLAFAALVGVVFGGLSFRFNEAHGVSAIA